MVLILYWKSGIILHWTRLNLSFMTKWALLFQYGENGALMSPLTAVWEFICNFTYSSISYMNFVTKMFGAQIFTWWIFSFDPYVFWMVLVLSDIKMRTQTCFFITICLNYFFAIFFSELISILDFKVCFLSVVKGRVLFYLSFVLLISN